LVLGWIGFAVPAMADDPYGVLRTAGLLGTWSQDCSTQAMTGSMTLVRFTMTSLGVPRVTVGGPDFIMYSATIEEAAPVAGGQISLTVDGGLSGAPARVMLRLQGGVLQVLQAGGWGLPLRRCISE
jgi:hypothetical protein